MTGIDSTSMTTFPILNKINTIETYHMVDTCDPAVCSWSEDGETFVVKHPKKFEQEIIPQFFKHSKFSSFVRQLNFYAFREIKTNDSIRIDAAAALGTFIPCVPLPLGSTLVEYTVQTLLIHLDDTSEPIREAVLPTLEVAARLCPDIVIKKTEEALKRQRPAGAALSAQVLNLARDGSGAS